MFAIIVFLGIMQMSFLSVDVYSKMYSDALLIIRLPVNSGIAMLYLVYGVLLY